MQYISFYIPPYPYFDSSGDALYRKGDIHGTRNTFPVFDIILLEYGELFVREESNSYQLKENDMLILSPYRKHYGYRRCHCETYFHWLHFYAAAQYELVDTSVTNSEIVNLRGSNEDQIIVPVFQSLKKEQAQKVTQLFKQLKTISFDRNFHNFPMRKAAETSCRVMQQMLFLDILSNVSFSDKNKQHHSKTTTLVIKFLEANYADTDITLSKLASLANCHPTHLIRCFKREYNLTPFNLLNNIRIQHAKEFLQNTDLTMEQIAELVGFSNGSYFSKVFKSRTGASPKSFRKIGDRIEPPSTPRSLGQKS